ncbi:MAG: hypothetical protein WC552_07980 [Candidatus Omnitrophota bacterium]
MKPFAARKRALLYLLLPLMMISLSGCVYLVVGGLGALGGYVISPDTVEGLTARERKEVWNTSVEIVSIMGVIEEKQEAGGIIIAVVNGAKVTINILPVGTSVKLAVKARKAGVFPKIGVAQDVYIKIMDRLNE